MEGNNIPTIDLYVWWSAGRGDGDGYDTDYEVTDEKYELFRKCLRDGSDPEDNEEIADVWATFVDEMTDELMGNSLEYEEESYRDVCLIDPDSDEYDPDGEEEQFTQNIRDWWNERYSTGVELRGFEVDEYTFNIAISDGGESEFDFNLYEDEADKLQELEDEGETLNALESDKDYRYLYLELMDAAKQKLREDVDLIGDDINDEDLEFSISF